MKLAVPFLFAMLLAGCVSSKSTKLSDEDKALCRGENPAVIMALSGCIEYGRIKRIRGVWYYGFEESRFVAGATRINSEPEKNDIPALDPWLLVDETAVLGRVGNPKYQQGCAMAIYLVFEGRHSIRSIPGRAFRRSDVIMVEQLRDARFLGYVRSMNTELSKDCQ